MSHNAYQVYDAKGNFHAGYDIDCRSWSQNDALKWAKITAKHIHGLIMLKSSESETLRVIHNFSHKKYNNNANSKNNKQNNK
tara:strand:- start:8346 stop:8591 length:246 start_codon:yes stop_codon:yes gene_type:complete